MFLSSALRYCTSKQQHRRWLQWRNRYLLQAAQPPLARRRIASLAPLIALLLLAFLLFVLLAAGKKHPQHKEADALPLSQIPPCTFEQLYAAFPPNKTETHQQNNQQSEKQQCWKLADEIVRVPVDSVRNRNALIPLGSGMLGGVHKAVIDLARSSSSSSSLEEGREDEKNDGLDHLHQSCAVAVKTDHCHGSFPYLLNWQRERSCLEEEAYFWSSRSYLGAEYTGALIWYAQWKSSAYVEGLLPTWGVLVDPSRSDQKDNRQDAAKLAGFPHPDPAVQGVFMPLQALTPASKVLDTVPYTGPSSVAALAEIMIPAAQGLAFAGSLGLAFRDLIEKNVGLLESTGTAVVYDNSLMGYKPPVDACDSVACNFCPEDVFPPFDDYYHHIVKGIRAGHPYIMGDVHNFRNVIIKMAQLCSDSDSILAQLTADLRQVDDADHLVRVLQNYSTTATS